MWYFVHTETCINLPAFHFRSFQNAKLNTSRSLPPPPSAFAVVFFFFGTLQFSLSTVKYTKPSTTISEMFFPLKILYCIVSALKASCKRREWWCETSTPLSLLIGRIIFLTHEKNIFRNSDWTYIFCRIWKYHSLLRLARFHLRMKNYDKAFQ